MACLLHSQGRLPRAAPPQAMQQMELGPAQVQILWVCSLCIYRGKGCILRLMMLAEHGHDATAGPGMQQQGPLFPGGIGLASQAAQGKPAFASFPSSFPAAAAQPPGDACVH